MSYLSSMQFATHSALSIGGDSEYDTGEHQTGKPNPNYHAVPDVMPLSSRTASSADRTTAWRIHRVGSSLPQPYSARTSGTLYNFDK